jgi:predicted ABC-type ATPase
VNAKPKVVVIAGPNGAGKSTTAPAIVQQAFAVDEFINADTIARGLSAFAPEHVALAAGRIMLRRIRTLASERVSFAFETTLATRSFKPLLRGMQQSGYELHLIFLWLPNAAMAIDRVAIRVKRGGHSVPQDVIKRRYERGLANFFNIYRPIADSWLMLDNSSDMAPRPIAWRNLGGPLQVVKSGPWSNLRERYERDRFDQLSPKNG